MRKEDDIVKSYEEKLELLRSQNVKDRDLLLNKMKKEQNDLKKSRDEAVGRANESAKLVVELRNRMEELESDLGRQRDQTRTIKSALDNSQKLKHSMIELNEKLRTVTDQLQEADKEKKHYMKQNLEQAKSVGSLVGQISQLEKELHDLAKLNEETANLAK